jgi:TetR/AcrR family transcriptional repressor of nem operon
MARPRELDAEQALDAAISVFREHGYEGSSAQLLVDAMGIGRQSLYATFGDKWQLYRSAVRRYGMGECAAHFGAMRSGVRASTESTLCCIASLKRPINLVSASVRSMSSAPLVPT